VVQNNVLISNSHSRRNEIANSPNDAALGKVAPRIIILPNNQNSRVTPVNGEDKVVYVLKIVIVVTKEDKLLTRGVSEMHRIIFACTWI